MSLVGYQPVTREIALGGESSFHVKGLSLTDFTTLVNHHISDLEALFDIGARVMGGKAEIEPDDITRVAISLCEEAPGFAANLIALASGEEDLDAAVAAASSLPFPTQLKALSDIADLTFAEVGGIKKAMALVAERLGSSKTKFKGLKRAA